MFFYTFVFLVKTSSKHRSLSLNYYAPLARSHANLYSICESNKGLINFSEVVAVIGDVQGFGLRFTPFDDFSATHLNKKGISPYVFIFIFLFLGSRGSFQFKTGTGERERMERKIVSSATWKE